MTLFRSCCVLTLLFSAYAPLKAAVIQRDWKTPGDGLLTYDDVNQREWLDLSQTILNEQFPGATRDDKYQYVISQLGIGGAFHGFTVAKIADVRALAASAGIDASVISSAANVAPVDELGRLLGFTILSTSGNGYVGLLDELGPPPMSQRVGAMFSINLIAQPPRAGLRINSNDDLIYSPSARPPAVMLYRAVPEGSSMLMTVLAGGGLLEFRRLRRRKRRRAHFLRNTWRRGNGFELLEDRRVLAPMADIVILFDESGSGDIGQSAQWAWLKDSVFAPSPGLPSPIAQVLSAKGFNDADVRYGLVGFGGSLQTGDGFAHSYIVSPGAADPLFGTSVQMDVALENVQFTGGSEDGWDAFEHLIAEYKFRDGAVPVAILLQNQQGRNHSNTTLVREGLLAALQSKNVLVNTVIYGSTPDNFTYVPAFDLTPYGGDPNVRILGVEADAADNVPDGRHNFAGINTNTRQLVASAGATQAGALQVTYNGSNTGASGMVDTGKSILFSKTATSGLGASAAGYKATSVPLPNYRMDIGATTITAGSAVALPFSFNYYGTA